MKNLKLIAFTTVTGLFLTACGGGSSSESTTPPPTTAEIVPLCSTGGTVNVTGKTIQKVGTAAAEVKIAHSPDSTRTACMITGEAEII